MTVTRHSDRPRKRAVLLLAGGVVLAAVAAPAAAGTIQFLGDNSSTDLSAGEIALGDAEPEPSSFTNGQISDFTWANPANAGFDIKLSGELTGVNFGPDALAVTNGDQSAGGPRAPVTFEFFATGTSHPVAVTGFEMSLFDIDEFEGGARVVDFRFTDADGNEQVMVLDDFFTFGSALSAGTAVNSTDDIFSTTEEGGYDAPNVRADLDMGSTAIQSLTFETNDIILLGDATAEMTIIPEPTGALLLVAGGLMLAAGGRARRMKHFQDPSKHTTSH